MSGAHVFIDRSQFPNNVQRDLLESLRTRSINHKFHYDTYKQAAKWLALHEAYSPARRDESCLAIYDEAFRATARVLGPSEVHLIALGCGGGQKEARLIELLSREHCEVAYTASDVSLPLVLTALENAAVHVRKDQAHGVVCDLATATDLAETFAKSGISSRRLVTLFGIIPNFEPESLLSRTASVLQPADLLLLSANLAPGEDYAAGVEKVFPQYDNELTREWLLTLLLDLGFERTDGVLFFQIETDERHLRRITAWFQLSRARKISASGEEFSFAAGERLRVFFSYRHTLETLRSLLTARQFEVVGQWVNATGEEGVFLCRKGAVRQ
jgi:L-histidine Nalpha-methyltransferase